MSVLRLSDIGVQIGKRALLADISLTLEAGEVMAVIGPNGAGKTTLLRAISGDVQKQSGSVYLKERPMATYSPRERAKVMAVLTQHNALEFAFTGYDVVALARGPHATGAQLDHQVCRQAMAAMDVLHLSERVYPTLSGGERQRLQLARVLAQIWRAEDAGERLLLLDEPVTSLDIGHQHQLMQAVQAFAATGVAVLMTVHDMTLAGRYSHRLMAIKEGHCLALDTPDKVLTEPLIDSLFDTSVTVMTHPETGTPVVIGR